MDTTSEEFDWSGDEPAPTCPSEAGSFGTTLEEALEQRWITAAARGDEEAFRKLVELHQERVHHFCIQWLRDAEEAREATQDTFIRAYGALARYERRGRFSTWLYRIALNLCHDRHRSKSGRQRRSTDSFDDLAGEPACPSVGPDESLARSEDEKRLRSAIDSLPDKLRTVVILCEIERISQRQCAEILDCSERAVEGRLYRAKRTLISWLEGRGEL